MSPFRSLAFLFCLFSPGVSNFPFLHFPPVDFHLFLVIGFQFLFILVRKIVPHAGKDVRYLARGNSGIFRHDLFAEFAGVHHIGRCRSFGRLVVVQRIFLLLRCGSRSIYGPHGRYIPIHGLSLLHWDPDAGFCVCLRFVAVHGLEHGHEPFGLGFRLEPQFF